jgi:hypothetical protein
MPTDALEEWHLNLLLEAVQDMREMAVLDPSILEIAGEICPSEGQRITPYL